MLLSHLPPAEAESYKKEVLDEALLNSPDFDCACFSLPPGVNTEVYDFSHEMIIVNLRHSSPCVAKLLALTESPPRARLGGEYCSEKFWAEAFNYPVNLDDIVPATDVSLDDNGVTMIEIGYRDAGTGLLCTCYGAAHTPTIMSAIMAHYNLYRGLCAKEDIGLKMEISVLS